MNRKKISLLLVFCFALGMAVFGGYKFFGTQALSFEQLMGKNSKYWKNVCTITDFQTLSFYKNIYEKNKKYLEGAGSGFAKIPKVIHFIWLGPKPFPEESKSNIESWIYYHPDWKIKFWTDREQVCPAVGMERHYLRDFTFDYLDGYMEKTKNYGEKSDLWRYEILFSEGGVYVDHDVKCYAPFQPLHEAYDFYCTLEKPHLDEGFTSSIVPAICVIGSKPGHPILKQTMINVKNCWDEVEKTYAANPIKRVVNRTFKSFGEGVRAFVDQEENRDIVLPTSFLFANEIFSPNMLSVLKKKHLTLAKHFWEVEWMKEILSPNEQKVALKMKKIEEKNGKISKRLNRITLCNYSLLLSNFILLCFMIRNSLKRRKRSHGL